MFRNDIFALIPEREQPCGGKIERIETCAKAHHARSYRVARQASRKGKDPEGRRRHLCLSHARRRVAALSVYLDTSVLVPLFLPDPFAERAKRFLGTGPAQVVVSDFVAAEYASVVGIRVRNGALSQSAGRMAFSNFDKWCSDYAADVETEAADIRAASASDAAATSRSRPVRAGRAAGWSATGIQSPSPAFGAYC